LRGSDQNREAEAPQTGVPKVALGAPEPRPFRLAHPAASVRLPAWALPSARGKSMSATALLDQTVGMPLQARAERGRYFAEPQLRSAQTLRIEADRTETASGQSETHPLRLRTYPTQGLIYYSLRYRRTAWNELETDISDSYMWLIVDHLIN